MQSKPDKKKTKQTYQKPRLRTIELSADEVLATGCKIPFASPAIGSPQCNGSGCVSVGS